MNLKAALLKENSKKQTLLIAATIATNPKLFEEAMEVFFANEYILTQRCAAVINACFEKNPKLIEPYLLKLIDNLSKKGLHDAVKRNTVRMLQFMDIPKNLQGLAFENCMKLLLSAEEAIAIRVFAMTVLFNICKVEPELKNELIIAIETHLHYASKGFLNRAGKLLSKLKKL